MFDFNQTQLKCQAVGMQESLAQVSPIIFEECYCMNTDPEFVEKVKSTNEISEAKIAGKSEQVPSNPSGGENGYVGVHLFVMVHGF